MGKHTWLNCILSVVLSLSLTACYRLPSPPDPSSSAAVPDQSGPDRPESRPLTLAAYTDRSFHPLLTDDRINLTLTPLLYQGLFELDTSFTPRGVLCSDYEVSEDGLSWTFSLKPEVTFSDGTPLTAPIAVQSLALARTAGSSYAGRFSCISSISAVDDSHLRMDLTRPNSALPALLDIPITAGSDPRPAGTGPYVLTEQEDASLALVPRDSAKPTIPLVSVTQPRELTAAFQEGVVSLISTDLSATDAPGYSGNYHTVDYDTTALIYLGFHCGKAPFSSPAARRAAASALDRNALVSAAWSGHARASALPIHPASPLYDEGLARQLPTPDDARELMEQAGLSGRRVTLLVNRENNSKVAAARLVARQLEQAGLRVTVSSLGWADYLNALSNGQFDLYLGETALTADFDLTGLLSGGGRLNYNRWSSSSADRLLGSALSAPDDLRKEAVGELCSYLTQQMPITPLCFKRGSVLTCWDGGYSLSPTRANVFLGSDLY